MPTFIADLQGVELTKEQHAAIVSGVRKVVLQAIAEIDTGGDLAISRNLDDLSEKFRIPDLQGYRIREARNLFR